MTNKQIKNDDSVKEKLVIKISDELAKKNSPLKKIPLSMFEPLAKAATRIAKKAKAEGKTIRTSTDMENIHILRNTKKLLSSQDAKVVAKTAKAAKKKAKSIAENVSHEKTSDCVTLEEKENITLQEYAKKTARNCSLKYLQTRFQKMTGYNGESVTLPGSVDNLPLQSKRLNTIVSGMSADIINKMPLWHMYCIINFALDVGIAYGYNACQQHFPAATKGYSSGPTGNADQKFWADRVEYYFVKSNKKKPYRTRIISVYEKVTKEYNKKNNLSDDIDKGDGMEKAKEFRRVLHDWWIEYYPDRKNENQSALINKKTIVQKTTFLTHNN